MTKHYCLIRIGPPDGVDDDVLARHLHRLQPQSELLLERVEQIRRRLHARRSVGELEWIVGYLAEWVERLFDKKLQRVVETPGVRNARLVEHGRLEDSLERRQACTRADEDPVRPVVGDSKPARTGGGVAATDRAEILAHQVHHPARKTR